MSDWVRTPARFFLDSESIAPHDSPLITPRVTGVSSRGVLITPPQRGASAMEEKLAADILELIPRLAHQAEATYGKSSRMGERRGGFIWGMKARVQKILSRAVGVQ